MGCHSESGKGRQSNIRIGCVHASVLYFPMQLQKVLDIYLPFDDESSPLDGLTGLAFSTPG